MNIDQTYTYFKTKLEFKGSIDSEKTLKIVENFLKIVPSGAGDEWLFDYFLFHFSRRYSQKTRFGSKIMMPGWLFGKKALEDYRNCSDNERYYYRDVFAKEHNLSSNVSIKIDADSVESWREIERSRFADFSRRYIHCEELLLYSKNSKICLECLNKQICSMNQCS